jgi:hypothetical protein
MESDFQNQKTIGAIRELPLHNRIVHNPNKNAIYLFGYLGTTTENVYVLFINPCRK